MRSYTALSRRNCADHLTAKDTDFPVADLTPEYLTYEDDHDLDPDHGDLEVMPEIGDNYLSAENSIPRG